MVEDYLTHGSLGKLPSANVPHLLADLVRLFVILGVDWRQLVAPLRQAESKLCCADRRPNPALIYSHLQAGVAHLLSKYIPWPVGQPSAVDEKDSVGDRAGCGLRRERA